mmetsp:Transcript_13914/g.33730  ORF Transcript_13914/g.33730 Transcript_13914/m.33730 type:complete len:214 (-) Transcript_13914:371-1012(-)
MYSLSHVTASCGTTGDEHRPSPPPPFPDEMTEIASSSRGDARCPFRRWNRSLTSSSVASASPCLSRRNSRKSAAERTASRESPGLTPLAILRKRRLRGSSTAPFLPPSSPDDDDAPAAASRPRCLRTSSSLTTSNISSPPSAVGEFDTARLSQNALYIAVASPLFTGAFHLLHSATQSEHPTRRASSPYPAPVPPAMGLLLTPISARWYCMNA